MRYARFLLLGLVALAAMLAVLFAVWGCGAAGVASGGAAGRLAFISERDGNREIYVTNRDGTNQVNISSDGGSDMWPAWSPTTDSIAFISERTGGRELYTVRADGSGLHALTSFDLDGGAGAERPSWSPDGAKIVFSVREWCSTPGSVDGRNIAVVNADGSGLTTLTHDDPCDEKHNTAPVWSPDGSTIAFVQWNSFVPTDSDGVYLIDVDGTNLRLVASLRVPESLVWSHDGAQLAFTYSDSVNAKHVALIDPDGSGFQYLGPGAAPTWSPDDDKIAYGCADLNGLCIISRDGSGKVRILNEGALPVWSPDGDLIAFEWFSEGNCIQHVEVVRPDGTDRTVVADTGENYLTRGGMNDQQQVWEPAYCPDDPDCDSYPDATETACGSDPLDANSIPERVDGAFAGVDDDGNDGADEALPSGSESYDCDGDGWTGAQEKLIFNVLNTVNDQDPCGNNGWPADMKANNILDIGDMNSFTTPPGPDDGHGTFNYFGHSVPDVDINGPPDDSRPNAERWNLDQQGAGAVWIDVGDLNAINPGVNASTSRPPMFGGQPAFFTNGGQCPWPP